MTDTHPIGLSLQERPEPLIRSSTSQPLTKPVFVISCQADMTNLKTRHPLPFLAMSPMGAGNSFGVPWWLQVVEEERSASILDCGASAALARIALLAGIGWVVCRASPGQLKALYSDELHRERILTGAPQITPWPR
ncbi:hypothetical protein [Gluconobacter thailandicus]|uniref:hypothetical protein n=1 Tax=Gluconobacter thailandicus TaxID=257438 RepID=UPI000A472A2C|nr:hypothetical protein [Gluconobacter thailandicus]